MSESLAVSNAFSYREKLNTKFVLKFQVIWLIK